MAQPLAEPESLTPTQELVLEVLAGRHRTGERTWTFGSRHRRTIDALADLGYLWWKHGVMHGTVLAGLTDTGRAAVMSPTYAPPTPTPASTPMSGEPVAVRTQGHAVTVDGEDYRAPLGSDPGRAYATAEAWRRIGDLLSEEASTLPGEEGGPSIDQDERAAMDALSALVGTGTADGVAAALDAVARLAARARADDEHPPGSSGEQDQ